MPPTLHADLARLADREKVSLNTLIVGILSGAITWRQAGERGGSPAAPSVNGDGESAAIPARTPTAVRRERLLSVALTANLVIVVIAGLLAIGLLIALLVA
jgi:hypothetical protein